MTNPLAYYDTESGSVTHQMALPVSSISCCVFNRNDFFYQEQNALAFNRGYVLPSSDLFTVDSFPLVMVAKSFILKGYGLLHYKT